MSTQEEQPEPHEGGDAPETEAGAEESPRSEESNETRLERERDEFKALAQRAQADLINYRRRVDEERRSLEQNAANSVITRLLPIADDLQRAVSSMPDGVGTWGDGVRMVSQNVNATIEAVGVQPITPEPGATFDPAVHEAIHYQPTDDQPPGAVVQCVRPGYRSPDRVLRAAQVVVAQAPEPAGEAEADDTGTGGSANTET